MGSLGQIDVLISDLICLPCKKIINIDSVESVTSYIKFDVKFDKPHTIAPLTLTLDVERISWKRKKVGYYYAEALIKVPCPNCEKAHELCHYLDAPVIFLANLGFCRNCTGKLSPEGEEIEFVDQNGQFYIKVRAEMYCENCVLSEEKRMQISVGDFSDLHSRGRIMINFSGESLRVDDKAKIRILFLSANPINTGMPPLGLINEYKDICKEIKLSPERECFDLIQEHSVSLKELQSILLQHNPQIIHFSGHSNENGELIFENSEREVEYTSQTAIANLLKILGDEIRCVLLNACYSESQAISIVKHVDCVIGMSSEISDNAARQFAASFYMALGYRKSVKVAFDLACNQLDLSSIPEKHIPKLVHKVQVDPAQIFILKD